jgi:hypothetical protein
MDKVGARRRPKNGRETMPSGDGTPEVHALSEREDESARLRAQLSGTGRVNEGGV